MVDHWREGKLYCSRITRKLLFHDFKIDNSLVVRNGDWFKHYIHVPKVELDAEIPIEIEIEKDLLVKVTGVPSDHCPGSFWFSKCLLWVHWHFSYLFESKFGRYVHTGNLKSVNWSNSKGDMRFTDMVRDAFARVDVRRSTIDKLYLDTTFFDQKWSIFPPNVSVFCFSILIDVHPCSPSRYHR